MFLGGTALNDFTRVMRYARNEPVEVRGLRGVTAEGARKVPNWERWEESARFFPASRRPSQQNVSDRMQQDSEMVMGVALDSRISLNDIVRRADAREWKVSAWVQESSVQTERQFVIKRTDS